METASIKDTEIGNSIEKLTIHKKSIIFCKTCTYPVEYCKYSHNILIKNKDLSILNNKPKEEEKEKEKEVSQTETGNQNENKEKEKKSEDESELKEGEKAKEVEVKEKKNKKSDPKVVIEESKRGKRKHTTYVSGLERFGINMKDVSKLLSKKFACSANVSKNESGQDEIVLTGEFGLEIREFLLLNFNILKETSFKMIVPK